ncbi:unnamed protein product [Toxocara canis]|uniref:Methyltransferase-like 26 n=1 Tax=Toxocara canis TaxID=6265 RepID=A0A183UTZ4_TOXCA|nr:unnamed protein product [Toxocara canis]
MRFSGARADDHFCTNYAVLSSKNNQNEVINAAKYPFDHFNRRINGFLVLRRMLFATNQCNDIAMLSAPAAERNKQPILEVIQQYIDHTPKKLLEISSGSGQHVIHFASHLPNTLFQPSDIDTPSLNSIDAYLQHFKPANVLSPLYIDVSTPVDGWTLPDVFVPGHIDVMLNINMIHISSDSAVDGLFRAAGELLEPGSGLLITYGPYAVNGTITPQSNVEFDRSLRARNPAWGLRDIADLKKVR